MYENNFLLSLFMHLVQHHIPLHNPHFEGDACIHIVLNVFRIDVIPPHENSYVTKHRLINFVNLCSKCN